MTDTIELTKDQRERLEAFKDDLENDPHEERPTDSELMNRLLDTWEAAHEGVYWIE